jgi:hypothetical protein
MANATVKIQGLKSLENRLKRLSEKTIADVKLQVLDSATQIEQDAIRNAPNFLLIMGKKSDSESISVAQFINKTPLNNGFAFDVGIEASNEIPIYVEFGTGTDAASYVPTLPQEIQEAARKFYVNGKGSIMKQPYLIPAFLKESPLFIAELKKILKKNV